mgnify:CR=1 FL=1
MSRANEDQMGALHGLLADSYMDEIKRLKEAGESIPPSLLTSAAKFLKDNGIDRVAKKGDPEDKLADMLEEEFSGDNIAQFPGQS